MFNWSGSSRLPIANYLIFLFPTVAFVFYFPLHKSFLETALGNKLFLESFHVCDRALLTVIYKHTLKTIISLDKPPNPTIKNENRHLPKLHAKIANIRKDTLHKLTTYLAKNHGEIVIEDLNVSGMLKNGKLAKAISDMGFYEFRRQLEYKCQLYGSKLIVADRFFPSSKTCSNCGWHNPDLKLSDRWFLCVSCGSFIERDWNASINLSRWSHCQTAVRGEGGFRTQ